MYPFENTKQDRVKKKLETKIIILVNVRPIKNILYSNTKKMILRSIAWNAKCLISLRKYKLGDVIFSLKGPILATPTASSIQIGNNMHIEDEYGAWMNHSCLGNVIVLDKNVVAIKHIPAGHELTYNYIKNETALVKPYACFKCNTMIRGSDTVCPVYKSSY